MQQDREGEGVENVLLGARCVELAKGVWSRCFCASRHGSWYGGARCRRSANGFEPSVPNTQGTMACSQLEVPPWQWRVLARY